MLVLFQASLIRIPLAAVKLQNKPGLWLLFGLAQLHTELLESDYIWRWTELLSWILMEFVNVATSQLG